MRKRSSTLLVVSALLLVVGAGTTGFAAISIYGSDRSEEFLPAISTGFNSQSSLTISKPKVGQVIGTLTIPRIKSTLPIIEGTGAKELKRGVGHYVASADEF